MPILTYESTDAVPEALREIAVEKDGKIVVDVSPTAKLSEFRDNNIKISQERDRFASVFAKLSGETGLSLDKVDEFLGSFKDLAATKKLVDDGKLVADSSLEEALAARTSQMKSDLEGQARAEREARLNAERERDQLRVQLESNFIDGEVMKAATNQRAGVRPDAIAAVQREARDFFRVEEGRLIARDANKQIIYGSDGATPITPLEWIKTHLSEKAPYLFLASQGGGSNGGGVGGMSQADILKLDPVQRMALARANKS
jgi:hypothetical protein